MKPGRELDALVAEKVMGWTGEEEEGFWPNSEWVWRDKTGHRIHAPSEFSTDIAAAWLVMERLTKNTPRSFSMDAFRLSYGVIGPMPPRNGHGGQVMEWRMGWGARFVLPDYSEGEAVADTAPHAICLAALRVVGVEL